ncbi:SagB/ThcOx family dehydrogenase [Paramicrobacterium chengjingii]|uniref:SagB/ThcOx family dehydrogenase n=1 Tax=Paramicrobacterium chengjingii TaxID=2769067 RepID=A0ABX6YIL5_9MICO|nr:SagB/ThcOx family dehydrogenase [Microbacterium chengjingii]QPZ38666.1 SagB/ThcOx family dehydrogenase [Microbacterium chengjingii]
MIALAAPRPRRFGHLLERRRSTRNFTTTEIQLERIADALWHAAGETHEGRRVSASARATYPITLTLVAGAVTDLPIGTYRYEPREHALELVAAGDARQDVAEMTLDAREWIGDCPALLIPSANTTRAPSALADQPAEHARHFAWMEVGFLAQNVSIWAAETGLGAVVIAGFDDSKAKAVSELLLPAENELLAVIAIGARAR